MGWCPCHGSDPSVSCVLRGDVPIVSRDFCGCKKLTITYEFRDANGRKFRRPRVWNTPDPTAEVEHESSCPFNDDPPGPKDDPTKPCYLTKPEFRPYVAPQPVVAAPVPVKRGKKVKQPIISLDLPFGKS